jgi:ABC-2 type transport system ATP-binding protein
VVNHGQVIADGTPREPKERSRSAHVQVTLSEPGPNAAEVIAPLVGGRVSVSADGLRLGAAVDSAPGLATALVRALDQAGMLADNIEVRQPSLDDVFFALTGAHIAGDSNGSGAKGMSAEPTAPNGRASEGARA